MLLLLFSFIQSQQSPRLSPFVIAVAVLAFITGVSLLVYFFRRIKTSEKEAEEDWSLSRRSLFVNPEPGEQGAEQVRGAEHDQPVATDQAATGELTAIRTGETHESMNEQVAREPRPTQELQSGYPPAPERKTAETPAVTEAPPSDERYEPEPSREERPTEILASHQPEHSGEAGPIDETVPSDDEAWAGLEAGGQEIAPPAGADRGTQLLGSNDLRPGMDLPPVGQRGGRQAQPQVDNGLPPRDARVEHRAGREAFEPPMIEPLTPREQSSFAERQEVPPPSHDLYSSGARDKKRPAGDPIYGANLERRPPRGERRPGEQRPDTQALYGEGARYEEDARRVESPEPPSMRPAASGMPVAPSVASTQAERGRGRRSPGGSVLGLPAEPSRGPLILGEPVRSKDDMGIGALSNYGKPLEKDGGRGGTVALLAVILIIGGGLLTYYLSPSVNSAVNNWVKHLRGTDVEEARRAAATPKALIFPRFSSEVDKNQVKIKGAVDNIWNEPLENLTVEVSLQRGGDAPPEVRQIAVNPNPLPPNQRGTFDFEYEGKRDTGFTGYKITKLFSNGNEIRFTSPQKQ